MAFIAVAIATFAACSTNAEDAAAPPTSTDPTSASTVRASTVPTDTATASTSTTRTAAPATTGPLRPTTTLSQALASGAEFNDHTLPRLTSVDDFRAMARVGAGGQELVKFTITDFLGEPEISFADMTFYTLHDEYYWFRLLNGEPVRSSGVSPIGGLGFDTIDDIYRWEQSLGTSNLPLGLDMTDDGRILSVHFYHLNHKHVESRRFGLGNVVYLPPVEGEYSRPEQWFVSLEYADAAPPDQIARFMEIVSEALPDEIADNINWAVRSPVHEQTAQLMEAGRLVWHDRIVRYDDFIIPGYTEVYSAAVSVGRVRIIDDPSDLNLATDEDILILQTAPDWLPPAAAIITNTPQTPLAHVSVLARNRGIVSAHVGGVLDDPYILQLAGPRAPVAVVADDDGSVRFVRLTFAQYERWRELAQTPSLTVDRVDTSHLAELVDLRSITAGGPVDEATLDHWRVQIGGKATGMIALIDTPGVETPPIAAAIPTAGFEAHMAALATELDAVLGAEDFDDSERTRFLLLEGSAKYSKRYQASSDGTYLDEFLADNPPGSTLGDIVRGGGLVSVIEHTPIDPETRARLWEIIGTTFADLSLDQGLRFRSSSTVEDIEGFNGAGLYESATGFLDPERDRKGRTIDDAILEVWASYWGSEAYEERERSGIDHTSGAMAVLVHPRFDDDLELANGVAIHEVNGTHHTLTINVHPGDASVANPDPNVTPEIITVESGPDDATIGIEWQQSSSLSVEGWALNRGRVLELFAETTAVAERWLERTGDDGAVLDLEFKLIDAAWPAYDEATSASVTRIVVKQVRPLVSPVQDAQSEYIAAVIAAEITG
ncbi:MAG: hypothetical protein GY925_26810 [Actinomycetia bacterium]|nr:hypothetical protein [Actinomycetes bacterium]